MNTIRVIYSFARSGGTLVNQLLGVHPQCLVLSEVNPAMAYMSITEQAVEWLGLMESDEIEELSRLNYCQQVTQLHKRASIADKQLIIRDWVTVNYLPGCADGVIPSGQLEQKLYLEHEGFQLSPLVIARKSNSVYESIKQNFSHLSDLDGEVFSDAYLNYARAVQAYPVIHLEDLREQPGVSLKHLLDILSLNTDNCESLLNEFHNFKNCTGNTTLRMPNESAKAQKILSYVEPSSSLQNVSAKCLADLVEADRLLGYE